MVDRLVPDDEMSFLVSITGKMASICASALREVPLRETDKGIAALVIKYAEEIDKGNLATLAKLGPLLLQSMEALQMSPRARAQASKGSINNGQQPQPKSKLDELRVKRIERQNRTKNLHSPTTGTDS